MESILTAMGTGGVSAFGFQLAKGSWNPWLTLVAAILTGFSAGYTTGGLESALVASVSAIATHSALLRGTPLGAAMKVEVLPRVLRVISDLALALAKAFENKTP